MRKILLFGLLSICLSFQAEAQFKDLLNKAEKKATKLLGGEDKLDISGGLKEALNVGVKEAVSSLSAQHGYLESPYRILIPEDAQKVITKVKMVPGFQNVEKDLIAKMNEAAEIAAKKATPIFIGAIKTNDHQ